MINHEPEEGDLVTGDYITFFEVSGFSRDYGMTLSRGVKVRVPEDEDWRVHVKAYMDKESFWSCVWHVSDHGNIEFLSLEAE
jgi:hypothetical protein